MQFSLSRSGNVSLVIYDLVGRRVRGLVDGAMSAGVHQAAWDLRNDDGSQVPAGVYFVRMKAEGSVLTRTAIITR
jgi:flagellar hook assembly protein FlgD